LISDVWAIFVKDARSELRTRAALNGTLLFAVSALVMVSFALGPNGAPQAQRTAVLAPLLWILLFFAAMTGLSRVFVKEEEQRTAPLLRLAAPPSAVFAGKLAFNVLLLSAIGAVTVPAFMVVMEFAPVHGWAFASVLILGGFGLAISSTLVAAIIAKAQASGPLFAVLALPVTLPLLLIAVSATKASATGIDSAVLAAHLKLLVSYDGVTLIAGFMLFPFAWLE